MTDNTQESNQTKGDSINPLLVLGIIFMPYIFVWFLISKKYSATIKKIGFGYAGFIMFTFALLTLQEKKPDPKTNEVASQNKLKEEAESSVLVSIPLEFKGIKIGQTQEDIQTVFSGLANGHIYQSQYVLSCDEKIEKQECNLVDNLTIANQVPTSATFVFNSENKLTYLDPKNNFLKSLQLTVDERYFEEIAKALLKKYGKPTTDYEEPLNNKITGAESKYRVLMWGDSHKNIIAISNHTQDGSTYTPLTTFSMYNESNSKRDEAPVESDI